jgi:hypothetical protein
MRLTKRQLRALPLHELVDLVEGVYLSWRFSDRHSALEGAQAIYFSQLMAEVDRRRRRALTGSCTCELCFAVVEGF